MSHSGEQLVINYDGDQEPTGQSSESRVESNPYTPADPTDDEIDKLADQLGSYNEAYRVMGISRDDEQLVQTEVVKAQEVVNVGPAVSLGKRAVHLLTALDKYSAAASHEGLINRIESGVEKRWDLEQAVGSRDKRRREGKKEFLSGVGIEELKDAGYSEAQIQSAAGEDIDPAAFRKTYYFMPYSDSESERDSKAKKRSKFREALKRQLPRE